MSFNEISEVVPWLELAYDQGQDLRAPQPFEAETGGMRVFKSHAWERHCPKGCKYIVVVRDPCDVALSFFNFFQGWFFEPGDLSVDAFVQEVRNRSEASKPYYFLTLSLSRFAQFWLRRGVPDSKMQNASFFHHLLSWYTKRNDNDTLFLFFEDLKDDLPSQVRRIAKFISNDKWKCTDAAIDNAVRMSSFSFMREHSGHFNETLSKKARNVACGLSPDAGMNVSKVRSGKTGAGMKILSEELRAQISEKWIEVVGRETRLNSYEDLRSHVKEEEEAATK